VLPTIKRVIDRSAGCLRNTGPSYADRQRRSRADILKALLRNEQSASPGDRSISWRCDTPRCAARLLDAGREQTPNADCVGLKIPRLTLQFSGCQMSLNGSTRRGDRRQNYRRTTNRGVGLDPLLRTTGRQCPRVRNRRQPLLWSRSAD
jgi:hypothetical protein